MPQPILSSRLIWQGTLFSLQISEIALNIGIGPQAQTSSNLGGISCKGITLKKRLGNPPPRIAETPSGILNAVGLQNPGVDAFIKDDLPFLEKSGTVIIANIAGSAEEDYVETASRLNGTSVDMIELNISCPNVKEGGASFGTSAASVEKNMKKKTNRKGQIEDE